MTERHRNLSVQARFVGLSPSDVPDLPDGDTQSDPLDSAC